MNPIPRSRCTHSIFAAAILLAIAAPQPVTNAVDFTGLVPIIDMAVNETYEGYPPGLYPQRLNYLTGAALAERLHSVMQIQPLDGSGAPAGAPDGRIVLLSIGMSNTSIESNAFSDALQGYAPLNPAVLFVNGAVGGQAAEDIADPNAPYWNMVDQRLANAGVTADQVQAIWLKQATRGPNGDVVAETEELRDLLEIIVQILRDRFDNLRMVYASSRIYAGYATTALNPEPFAYASGFAVQSLIGDQIRRTDPGVRPGPNGVAPLIQWGPYTWADGIVPRSDGLTWVETDFRADGTHPSADGAAKVADQMVEHFSNDWTARLWFVRPPLQTLVGDLNGDFTVSVGDIGPFVLALTDPTGYEAQFPGVNYQYNADLNDDGILSVGDIGEFVSLLTNF